MNPSALCAKDICRSLGVPRLAAAHTAEKGLIKQYKVRWFVLLPNGKMFYYTSHQEGSPRRTPHF